MKLERRLTAAQLAGMAVAGSLLLYAGVWQIALPYHLHIGRTHTFGEFLWAARFEIALYILPLALGGWMMYDGLAAFRRGFEDTIWSEPSLAKLRTQLNRRIWIVLAYLMTAVALAYFVFNLFSRLRGSHHGGSSVGAMAYLLVSPLSCLMTLQNVLRPKPVREPGTWPGDIKPLVSKHWGERSPSHQIS